MTERENLMLGQNLAIKAPVQREVHLIDQKRWVAFRKRIENLATFEKNFASAAWAFVGVAISGLLAVATWIPAYRALPLEERADFTWTWVVLCAVAAIGIALAGTLFVVNKGVRGEKGRSVTAVLEEMDLLIEE